MVCARAVRERDEGRYLCRVTTSDGRIIMQDHVDLFVHFSVEEVSISLDGNQLLFLPRDITSTAGDHVMTCTVSSLAPGISMVVTHGNESMTLAPNVTGTADMEAGDGGQTLYRATLTAHVTFADRGPLYNWGWLGCEATPRGITGAVTFRKAVEVYVEGTRVVSCIPTVHSVGDLYVQLLCFVTFSHINTDISQYYWVYASTGQVIYPGQTNALHDEAFDVKVLNSTTALLRLELYELLPLHVSPGIYLMTSTLDGRLFLEKVPLTLRHV
ncbi:hypothetical protein BaRGS_00014068 [Batillaria attramentaria]|uniref:Ig-like domain-containing protein n=1 Tax=Batillaria attramentaria TaxID=370345 RepID=A0ABD0L5N0_9CAEN